MSLAADELPAPETLALKPGLGEYHEPLRQGVIDFIEAARQNHSRGLFPNLQLWGVSVLIANSPDGGYDPVWIGEGEPNHPYSRENWGNEPEERLYPIEEILVMRRVATSHSNWKQP